MKKRYLILLIILILAIFAFAIFGLQVYQKSESGKIKVSTSFYPLYFFATQVAGDKADVYNVTPAGAEPHDYEPTAQDMANLESSNMLIFNGEGLEAWADNVKQNLSSKTLVVVAGENLATKTTIEDGNEMTDPHIWLSPALAKEMANKILEGFIQLDPENREYYQSNAEALILKLDNLDNEYRQGLADCKNRSIITSHSAFGYLASAYGLEQVSVAGLAPDEESSPQQLAGIVEFAKINNIKYIFSESLVSPRLSETIANEIGAQTLVLNPIEGLTSQEISRGKDYFTQMQDNLTNLKTALECQ